MQCAVPMVFEFFKNIDFQLFKIVDFLDVFNNMHQL